MAFFPKTAQGMARLATEQEIAREDYEWIILTDDGEELLSDAGDNIIPNVELGFTNPDLHRRIDQDVNIPADSDYLLSKYRNDIRYLADLTTEDPKYLLTEDKKKIKVPLRTHDEGFKQTVEIGVWGDDSYRTTTFYTHDEESEDEEIP